MTAEETRAVLSAIKTRRSFRNTSQHLFRRS